MNKKLFDYVAIHLYLDRVRDYTLGLIPLSFDGEKNSKESSFPVLGSGMFAEVRVDPTAEDQYILALVTNETYDLLRCVISYKGDSRDPKHVEFIGDDYNPDVIKAFDEYFNVLGGLI